MAFTKAQLEGLKNTLLAPQQPITALQHQAFVQNMIDEMYDAQSRADILVGVQADTITGGSDTFIVFRNGEAYQIPLSVLSANSLANLGDVFINNLEDGNTLIYNAVAERWENQNIFLGFAISNLDDVELTSLANGDILRYDSTSEKWENTSLANILSSYVTLDTAQTISGFKTFSSTIFANDGVRLDQAGSSSRTRLVNLGSTFVTAIGTNQFGFNSSNNIYFAGSNKFGGQLAWNNTGNRTYTLQDASGTIALTSDLHNPVTLGTANGLSLTGQALSLGLASGSTNGALSSDDWNTFNSKVGGSGTAGQVSFWTGAGTQSGDSGLVWDNVNKRLGINDISSNDLTVLGTSLFRGALRIRNNGSGTGDFAVFRMNNDIGEDFASQALMFLNSSTRTGDGGQNTFSIRNNIGALRLMSTSGQDVSIWTSTSAERMRITSAGNVGIGNTADLAGGGRLQVTGDVRATGDVIGKKFISAETGNINMASGEAFFVFDLTTLAKGTYLFNAVNTEATGNIAGLALVHITNTSRALSTLGTSVGLFYSLSGTDLTATQTTGSTRAVKFYVTALANL